MFQKMLLKKMIKSKLGSQISDEQADQIITLIEKNPALFQKMAKEIEDKVKHGKGQQAAAMEVFREHQVELKDLKL